MKKEGGEIKRGSSLYSSLSYLPNYSVDRRAPGSGAKESFDLKFRCSCLYSKLPQTRSEHVLKNQETDSSSLVSRILLKPEVKIWNITSLLHFTLVSPRYSTTPSLPISHLTHHTTPNHSIKSRTSPITCPLHLSLTHTNEPQPLKKADAQPP